ncbi:MAG: hypothetical protein HC876_21145 [Chloroflexaceae bacterium]|nr:hypothetical protein [Chloroflexaceae bacterium]
MTRPTTAAHVRLPIVPLPGVRLLLSLVALLLILAGGLALLWRTPALLRVDVGSAADEHMLTSFYDREATDTATYRWTGPGSRLLLTGTRAAPAVLRLHLDGQWLARTGDTTLALEQAGRTVATIDTTAGWRTYSILLPADTISTSAFDAIALDLVSPTTRPDRGDDRLLGVALDWFELAPLVSDGAGLAYVPWLRIGLLCWLVALVALLLMVVLPMAFNLHLFATQPPTRGPLRFLGSHRTDWLIICGPLLVGGGGLLWWAAAAPANLLQTLPLSAAWLALATVLLLLLLAVSASFTVSAHGYPTPLDMGLPGMVVPSVVLLLVANLLLLPALPLELRGGGALLVLALPGALVARRLFVSDTTPLERLFLSLCGAITLPPLLLLALHALPGGIPWWLLLLCCNAIALLCAWNMPAVPAPAMVPRSRIAPQLFLLAMVIVLGCGFRLLFLGSAEFQGDEVRPLLVARGMLYGDDELLLLRTKGPVESLLSAGPLILTMQMTEWMARLPSLWRGSVYYSAAMCWRCGCCAAGSAKRAQRGWACWRRQSWRWMAC